VYADKVDAFVLQAPLLFRYAPIQALTLCPEVTCSLDDNAFKFYATRTATVQTFFGIRELSRLTFLSCFGPFDDQDAFAKLVSTCPNLSGLQRLGLGYQYSTFETGPCPPMQERSRQMLIARFGERLSWLPDEWA
jgi:hypothetical protein